MYTSTKCPRCSYNRCHLLSTENGFKNYCTQCDIRFNDVGVILEDENSYFEKKREYNRRYFDAFDSPVTDKIKLIRVVLTDNEGKEHALGIDTKDWPDIRKGIYALSKSICGFIVNKIVGDPPEVTRNETNPDSSSKENSS